MLAVLLGAALVGYGARFALRFALKKYEARLTDRIRSDVESKMLSPPERPPRATPRRDYDCDTVRNLPLPLAPTAPMRPPGFDAYSRATRSAGPYVYSRAPPATPHSSRSRRSPLVTPYTPQSRRSAKVAPTPTSPLEAELSELRSRLEAVEAPIAAEVAELRARLDFVERASPHHSPDAADRVHRADASPYSSASRTRASGVNADHAGERAWPMIPRRLEDALDAVAEPAPAPKRKPTRPAPEWVPKRPTRPAPEYHPRDRPAPDPLSAPPGSRDSYGHGRHPSRRRSMNDEAAAPSTPPAGDGRVREHVEVDDAGVEGRGPGEGRRELVEGRAARALEADDRARGREEVPVRGRAHEGPPVPRLERAGARDGREPLAVVGRAQAVEVVDGRGRERGGDRGRERALRRGAVRGDVERARAAGAEFEGPQPPLEAGPGHGRRGRRQPGDRGAVAARGPVRALDEVEGPEVQRERVGRRRRAARRERRPRRVQGRVEAAADEVVAQELARRAEERAAGPADRVPEQGRARAGLSLIHI